MRDNALGDESFKDPNHPALAVVYTLPSRASAGRVRRRYLRRYCFDKRLLPRLEIRVDGDDGLQGPGSDDVDKIRSLEAEGLPWDTAHLPNSATLVFGPGLVGEEAPVRDSGRKWVLHDYAQVCDGRTPVYNSCIRVPGFPTKECPVTCSISGITLQWA